MIHAINCSYRIDKRCDCGEVELQAMLEKLRRDREESPRIQDLEDAITEAGIILAGGIPMEGQTIDDPVEAIRLAMRRLGKVMGPEQRSAKRQGI